jgi:type II secretory pathway pseudopilin PulG
MRTSRIVSGFTLIELLVFIVISGLVMSTLLIGALQTLRKVPTTHFQWVAIETAQRCMEWFLDQRRINGYATLTCPSTPSPTACSAPSGYSVSTSITCTTWNSDSNYKTITVSVTGLASVSLTTMVGDYQ